MKLLLGVVAALLIAAAPAAADTRIFAVTDAAAPHLLSVDPGAPSVVLSDVALSGLAPGEVIRGMDLRPVDGTMYALTTAGSGGDRLRPVDLGSGVIGVGVPLSADPSDATAPYAGSFDGPTAALGIDFNPAVDRLRIVSCNTGLNDRVNPSTGGVLTDGTINTGESGGLCISGVAYTNSYPGSVATTLYDFNWNTDRLMIQNPPNNGTVTNLGVVGGFVTGSPQDHELDIATDGNAAYLSAPVNALTGTRLLKFDLTTGAATDLGAIGDSSVVIAGIATAENLVSLPASSETIAESAGTLDVPVVRAAPSKAMLVDYAVTGATAVGGQDFTPSSGTMSLAAGQTVGHLAIPIADDTSDEAGETFTVTLSNPRQATAGDHATATLAGPSTLTVTIADDDPATVTNTVTNTVTTPGKTTTVPAPAPVLAPGNCKHPQTGTSGDDSLLGTSAGDKLSGLGGDDALFGNAGDDCLVGGNGNDWLSGGAGNDTLDGGAGNDRLVGGAGNDKITAGSGTNTISAGAGNDTVNAKNGKKESVDCGSGKDTATVDKRDKTKGCEKVKKR